MTAVDEIKARLNIIDLISETVKLRRTGKNYTGFCPFHPNSRTPAFVVFPDSGTWRCFGQCNEGGDIFKFVMKKEGWDFPQALRYLADRAGVQLEPQTPERQAEDEEQERLRALLEEAAAFYRRQLTTPGGQPALTYLQKRGLTSAAIDTFGLGYAPDSWDAAFNHLTQRGYSSQEMLAAGLLTERQGGMGVYDRFRNRIMFPIRDAVGRMAGFGARILDPNDVPKFLNSPQTALFDKGRLLYGLDQARKAIRSQDQVVIVEGYLDVIALHQGGFTNTVSPMGTALTEEQLKLLKRFTRRIVLALDADAAGEKATLRGLEVARQSLDRETELSFDARGLLHHEARLQADVRVTTLPPGMDPDEVVLRNPAEWAQILAAAKPIVSHVMDTLVSGRDVDDPKVKTEIAGQVLPLIEDVPSPIERDAYRQRLARLLKVDERSLVGGGGAPARPGRPARRSGGQTSGRKLIPGVMDASGLAHALEAHILRLMLRQSDAVYQVDRALQQGGLGPFSPQDFEHADHQVLARLLLQSLEQDHMDAQAFFNENLPESLRDLVEEMQAPMKLGEPSQEKLVGDVVDTIVRLRLLRITTGLDQLRYLQQEVQEQGEITVEAYQQLIPEYTRTKNRLERLLGQSLKLDS